MPTTPKRESKTLTRPGQKQAETGRTPDQEPAYVAVVRRGSTRRFARLQKYTAELPLEVVWDSRHDDRRTKPGPVKIESRRAQRRHDPPFTWEAADFLVRKETRPARRP